MTLLNDWRFWFAMLGIFSTSTLFIFKAGGLSRQLRTTVGKVEDHDGRIDALEMNALIINVIKDDVREIKQVQKKADEKREESREAYIAEITEIKTCLKFIMKEISPGKPL